ncbi:AzlD domain-containing protein [Paenibacillus brevis]|uniref:AzlD domain-containing protein n=1 Tax=Paenibacillus brevis TaxID=2841508 RepID=A0ABS6FNI4_9BACL|nr:AzlD domain-containing protein [Paenibacillus brevis]MBU5671784.1 AzlD domain-containing protein [Paenibacillus brevis]
MENLFWIIAVTGVGTYLFRAGSLVLGSRVKWNERTKEWLSYVSPAVLGAMLGPVLLLSDNRWVSVTDNAVLLAALPTMLIAWKTRRFLLTVTAGILLYALIRYLIL